jgi:L-2,4-diaminobutyrate decarboxylase
MDRSVLPEGAFVAPDGDNASVVRTVTKTVINQLLDQLTAATERSPLPLEPAVPAADIPETSQPFDAILDEMETIVAESMNPAHPGYIGHMDTIPTTASVLGDLVAAAINNNMLSVEMAPVLSELEMDLVETIAKEFGLSKDAGGVMTAGGSLATLEALAVARNQAFDALASGIAAGEGRPVVFASEVAHTSLEKATMLLGLGTDAVVPVATTDDSQMCPDALRTSIQQAEDQGHTPFCVVGTAGTTTTGNIDPLGEIHEIAAEHDLWFHVDAAYGGALVFAEQERNRLAGIEHADSITFNPQKWCYVAKTCAMVLFDDQTHLGADFQIGAPYMRTDRAVANLGELSVQGTRHADVLKCWLTFQHLGRDGIAQLIEEGYRLTEYFLTAVDTREFLEVASQPELNLICFRAVPEWIPQEQRDEWNLALQEHLLQNAEVFLSAPMYRDHRWLRTVLLNLLCIIARLQRDDHVISVESEEADCYGI